MLEHLPQGNISLRAQDIQTGLQDYTVSEFRSLTEIGWAARIAIHLRSSGPVLSHRLEFVAEHLFGVNKWAFPQVLRLLEQAGLTRVIGSGEAATVVPQSIPYFNGLYERLDQVATAVGFNEHEQLSVDLLHRLSACPASKSRLLRDTGAESEVFDRVLSIGGSGSYLGQVRVADSEILISPLYFSENAAQFAKIVERHGESAVKRVIALFRQYAGWPLSHILKGRVGPETLTGDELEVARSITSRALTQPPSITARGATNHFVFTPMVGTTQIEVIEKEVYERAIAIVAAIRHGQHFEFWEIKYPTALLRKLMQRPITPPSGTKDQYKDLALRQIVRFDPPPPQPFQSVVFIDNPENRKAVGLAMEMLAGHEGQVRTPSPVATKLLSSDATYTEFLRGLGRLKSQRLVPKAAHEVAAHIDQLLEYCMKGA